MHEKFAWCRHKGLGSDACIIGGAVCKICDGFTSIQRQMLATPQYQIRKDKKAGLLVSPKDVTVLSPVNSTQQQDAANAHAQTIDAGQQHDAGTVHAQHLPGGSDNVSSSVYVSKKDFNNLSQQLDEHFPRFEALLSRGNIFATPKVLVNVINPPVSQQPFIDQNASARATGPASGRTGIQGIWFENFKEEANPLPVRNQLHWPGTSCGDLWFCFCLSSCYWFWTPSTGLWHHFCCLTRWAIVMKLWWNEMKQLYQRECFHWQLH